ncbi:MAG: hypothetical protein WA705_15985 [Candidatus Ozemobacteraceae bacterium]
MTRKKKTASLSPPRAAFAPRTAPDEACHAKKHTPFQYGEACGMLSPGNTKTAGLSQDFGGLQKEAQ